ncbi:MAG: TetR/AcrR family transcriptional regulator [Microthrixaceae bacterium]|nr:TetR/AcrR family transcriptional regulator [Microthrixaceae bacterium]MCO5321560.1 TetR/AcrR family transcriptional regulator [Microthrixaceae bacterium]
MVNTGRRARNRAARHSQLVAAASAIVAEKGLDGLTMQEVAERVDCAVGTIYTYFSSKSALLAALQVNAIRVLADSYEQAARQWDAVFALRDLDDDAASLVRLIGLGRLFVAWPRLQPREFDFLQMLVTTPERLLTPQDSASVLPMALALFAEGRVAHDLAVEAGALAQDPDRPGDDGTARTVRWIASLDGAVMVSTAAGDLPQDMDAGAFDLHLMADHSTRDHLQAWGAQPDALEGAFALVDEMAAEGSLLPETIGGS